MLGLRFQIGVGSVIENTQIVFISESLNDFALGVNIRTAPHVVVSIEVTYDKYLASYVSDQVWQISGCEVVVAWDVDRKKSDRCTTQSHLDCYRLEVRVNLNHLVVEFLLDVDHHFTELTWRVKFISQYTYTVYYYPQLALHTEISSLDISMGLLVENFIGTWMRNTFSNSVNAYPWSKISFRIW